MKYAASIVLILVINLFARSPAFAASAGTGNVEISAFADQGVELQAEIEVDGHAVKDRTPTSLILPEGRHTVVISYAARRWEREIKVVSRRVLKLRVKLVEEVEESPYSVAVFAGGGYMRQAFKYNAYEFSTPYGPSIFAALDFRSNRWPVSVFVSGASLLTRTGYGYLENTLESAIAVTSTSYELTIGPAFYYIFDRSLRNKTINDVPQVGENFLAVQLIVPSVGIWSVDQSTTYLNDNRILQQSSLAPNIGIELNLYGQSKKWCGKAGLSIHNEQRRSYFSREEHPANELRPYSHAGFIIQVGRVIGF